METPDSSDPTDSSQKSQAWQRTLERNKPPPPPGMKELTSIHAWRHACCSRDNPPRRSGKTTGEVLIALGRAMIEPGKNVELWDKSCRTVPQKRMLLKRLTTAMSDLGLDRIVVGEAHGSIWVRSENFGFIRE